MLHPLALAGVWDHSTSVKISLCACGPASLFPPPPAGTTVDAERPARVQGFTLRVSGQDKDALCGQRSGAAHLGSRGRMQQLYGFTSAL